MNKSECYKYKLWAWTYIDTDTINWSRTIYRKNKLSDKQKEDLSGRFADKLALKCGHNIMLYGCAEVESN